MTVLREWRGRTEPGKVEAAIAHYRSNLKPHMTTAPGFVSASLAWRDLGRMAEIVILSVWRDLEALKAFAGPAPERAVLPPGTGEVVADPDAFVRLYEIADEASAKAA